jgi:RPA family protein
MPVEMKRISAVKTDIKSLISGTFVKQEGFEPSYVVSKKGQKLSRVRIMGTITDKFISPDNRYASATIDDNTENLRAKAFKTIAPITPLNKGDIVDMIGRVRMYNEELYLMPEIVYRIDDPNMLLLRRAELISQKKKFEEKRKMILEARSKTSDFDELKKFVNKKYGIEPDEVEAVLMVEDMPKAPEEKESAKESEKDAVVRLMERLDTGSGCEYSTIIKESGMSESSIESVINELLSDGVCFEPRPGVIKLL